jgi:hypothetical protein
VLNQVNPLGKREQQLLSLSDPGGDPNGHHIHPQRRAQAPELAGNAWHLDGPFLPLNERTEMLTSASQLFGTAATAYGVIAALTALLQARQMLARRTSCEVSGRFFASYVGGYAIWLLYGLSVGSTPLIVVDSVGLLCGGLTLAVALSLRGSLVHPATWMSCNASPVSEESNVAGPASHADR